LILGIVGVHDEPIPGMLGQRGIQPSPVHVKIVAIVFQKIFGPIVTDEKSSAYGSGGLKRHDQAGRWSDVLKA